MNIDDSGQNATPPEWRKGGAFTWKEAAAAAGLLNVFVTCMVTGIKNLPPSQPEPTRTTNEIVHAAPAQPTLPGTPKQGSLVIAPEEYTLPAMQDIASLRDIPQQTITMQIADMREQLESQGIYSLTFTDNNGRSIHHLPTREISPQMLQDALTTYDNMGTQLRKELEKSPSSRELLR